MLEDGPAGVRAALGLCRRCDPGADRGGVLRARRAGGPWTSSPPRRQEPAAGGGGRWEPRFRMLETIRQFAAEQLAARASRHLGTGTRRPSSPSPNAARPRCSGRRIRDWTVRARARQHPGRDALGAGRAAHRDRAPPAHRLLAVLADPRLPDRGPRYAERHLRCRTQRVSRPEQALEAAGGIAYWQGDTDAARVWYRRRSTWRGHGTTIAPRPTPSTT